MKKLGKHITLVILFCWGLLLVTGESYACSKKTAKTGQEASLKKPSSKKGKEDCCKTNSCKKDNGNKKCGSKCQHSSCRCSSFSLASGLLLAVDLREATPFATTDTQKFGFKQAYCPSGHYSIWQPPKIS